MKNNYTLLIMLALVALTFEIQAQTFTLYPGVTSFNRHYDAPFVTTPPTIDGNFDDPAWALAPWAQAQSYSIINSDWTNAATIGTPVEPEGAFSGESDVNFKYKIIWDNSRYYMLLRYKDDKDIYSDLHSGYPGNGTKPPPFNPTWIQPAIGAGSPTTGYTHWRMDQIALWMVPYQASYLTSYNRTTSGGVNHSFYPGAIKSTQAGAVIWADKTNAGATHMATVAGKFDDAEGAYYIEFKDSTWANAFFGSWLNYSPHSGDSLLLGGEVNDADGTTNRRDYNLTLAAESGNPATNLTQAVRVYLIGGPATGIATTRITDFTIYPNPNSSITLRLNKATDVEIYNITGQKVKSSNRSSSVDISDLKPGVYMVGDGEGNVRKLVRE